ncbi:signal peptidase I [Candidatus Borrarchaeum sp.]|uniref:signal peptidase I n=1 Tax=Candidatus Borrarchaeum sp. TaxID=2846742 RepID=UPI002580ECE0|nr:signal peptidase I [Candidatus Borrarchaeum sp.]
MKKSSEQNTEEQSEEKISLELILRALKNQKKVKLPFRGQSMEPSIKDGEEVFFQKVTVEQIKIGDIILFKKAGTLIGHRVLWKVKLKTTYFLTKGDNSYFADRPIQARSVFAKVIELNSKNKYSNVNFKTKIGFLLEIFVSKLRPKQLKKYKIFRSNISRKLRGNFFHIFN